MSRAGVAPDVAERVLAHKIGACVDFMTAMLI